MERTEIIAIVSLLISIFLLLKHFRMQSRINELTSDLARLEGRSEVYPPPRPQQPAVVDTHFISSGSSELSPELEQRLRQLLDEGNKIKAIKELREAMHLSLKDAKDYVDAMDQR
ncbi:hypothetical protein GCM10008915_73230 [Bifidobacterium pullorum subsp. gallinarum]